MKICYFCIPYIRNGYFVVFQKYLCMTGPSHAVWSPHSSKENCASERTKLNSLLKTIGSFKLVKVVNYSFSFPLWLADLNNLQKELFIYMLLNRNHWHYLSSSWTCLVSHLRLPEVTWRLVKSLCSVITIFTLECRSFVLNGAPVVPLKANIQLSEQTLF